MKEKITNLLSRKNSIIFKKPKEGQSSFRITKQLLQTVLTKAKKLKQLPSLIITIPANKNENFIMTCQIHKEKN